jgi:outer membrane protein OmpA-like peptidoglycan-associated protein
LRFAAIAAAALLAAACASLDDKPHGPELFAVIPSGADGHVGAIVVHRAGKTEVVNTAYGAERIDDDGLHKASVDPEKLKHDFAETLAALPAHPAHFTLYFREGSDELTPESRKELKRVLAELRKRSSPDIAVTGHADAVGTMKYNDQLSMTRAERMREILVEKGMPADRIAVAGRGKREPIVVTSNGVPEPRNRRVEIEVR